VHNYAQQYPLLGIILIKCIAINRGSRPLYCLDCFKGELKFTKKISISVC